MTVQMTVTRPTGTATRTPFKSEQCVRRTPYTLNATCYGYEPELPQCIGSDNLSRWLNGNGVVRQPIRTMTTFVTPTVINLTDDNGDVVDARHA